MSDIKTNEGLRRRNNILGWMETVEWNKLTDLEFDDLWDQLDVWAIGVQERISPPRRAPWWRVKKSFVLKDTTHE